MIIFFSILAYLLNTIYALTEFAFHPKRAQAVVRENVLDLLLKSPHSGVRKYAYWTLSRPAFHKSTVGAVLVVEPCASLVTLLRDPDILVVEGAIYALARFASDPNGAQAVVDANVLNFVHELLKSPHSGVRRDACSMLGSLALYKSTVGAVLAVEPCASLVTLLRDPDILVVEGAISVLSQFASDPKGAQAVVDANALDLIHELLESPNSEVRKHACWVLGNLGSHTPTLGTVLAIEPCVRLVSLLRETDSLVVEGTIYALSQFPRNLRGAKAVMDANILDIAHELFESSNSQVRANTCRMIGWLARHDSTAGSMLRIKPCARLVDLSKDSHVSVVEAAVFALCKITTNKPEGVDAVLGAGVLDLVQDLLASPNFKIRRDSGSVNFKGVSYCSQECQKAHWPKHKLSCSAVDDSGISKLVQNFYSNPVLSTHLQACFILDFDLLHHPLLDSPFMARVDIGIEPADMPESINIFMGERVSDKMRGMLQEILRTARRSAKREPVGLVEFGNGESLQTFTFPVYIQSAAMDLARASSPWDVKSSITGQVTEAQFNIENCMQFMNTHIRGDKKNQLLLRTDMRPSDIQIIRDTAANSNTHPTRILKAKMAREQIFTPFAVGHSLPSQTLNRGFAQMMPLV
ncbi:armadillo-type protein [Mycena crocata]|nr:armadillo-type protein [Mycena crocata]